MVSDTLGLRDAWYFATHCSPGRELAQAPAPSAAYAWSRSAGNERRRFRRPQVVSADLPNRASWGARAR
jgi:hypothetical protein